MDVDEIVALQEETREQIRQVEQHIYTNRTTIQQNSITITNLETEKSQLSLLDPRIDILSTQILRILSINRDYQNEIYLHIRGMRTSRDILNLTNDILANVHE